MKKASTSKASRSKPKPVGPKPKPVGPKSKPAATTKPNGSVAELVDAAECLKTLAHPVRLRMVQLLLHGRYTVGELAEDCQVPQNVASEHLRLMQRCKFFASEREGRRVYYEVAEPHLEKLMACVESRFLNCKETQ